nr:mitotic checkpoint serine/threonine-protein kinase BUB1 [Nerophis lumbriciformis]
MDVESCLKAFESSFTSYAGDDPLDVWIRFVEYLDQSLPPGGDGMSTVLERLVQNFLGAERYANDVRFVRLCIICATYYSEPEALLQYVFSKGVGTRTAALYVSWAQHLERKAMREEADAVYLKAMENRAEPVQNLMQEYRQFQARNGSREMPSGGGMGRQPGECDPRPAGAPAIPSQIAAELPANGVFYVSTISRSEVRPVPRDEPERELISMYSKHELQCSESELCFEEVRARMYFLKRKEKREAEERLQLERAVREDREAVARLRRQLDLMDRTLQMSIPMGQPVGCDAFMQEEEQADDPDASRGSVPDNSRDSMSCAHVTPSRVPPSPTVNTREALDVIMGMFQAPTLSGDAFGDRSALFVPGEPPDRDDHSAPPASFASTEPFTIYQDDVSVTNSRTSRAAEAGALSARCDGRLAACPEDTADFATAAHCVSTPFAQRTAYHVAASGTCVDGDENTFVRRLQKLSPILEQSPPDEKLPACGAAQESVTAPQPAALSFGERTQGATTAEEPFAILEDTPREPVLADPWNDELISRFLSEMSPPLSSHPQYISWRCCLPNIAPKMTVSMGNASLRVDRILGQGAFATVYQASDPTGSDKLVLKVQKPANPWEFYINAQLDRRLGPHVRHLFGRVHSAHVFTDGSVLLAELHGYGTLLNTVNLYKNLGDKVMPQPLVMYFTVCILRMLEELHAARVIHADIKPDNFMLGQRFAENDDLDPENLEHGLVLVDFGQSLDMTLFPEGAAFTAKCLTSGFQCPQMLSGKPWNYQTDMFGVAATAHVLLFGMYMQLAEEDGMWMPRASFRRNPHADTWRHFFRTLLNVDACHPAPEMLADLRRRLTDVLRRDYSGKMASLKSRLLVLLLESSKAGRR